MWPNLFQKIVGGEFTQSALGLGATRFSQTLVRRAQRKGAEAVTEYLKPHLQDKVKDLYLEKMKADTTQPDGGGPAPPTLKHNLQSFGMTEKGANQVTQGVLPTNESDRYQLQLFLGTNDI